ncbi:MAG: hypothetical protein ACSLE5_06115 [Porticoccaceae bacterium]
MSLSRKGVVRKLQAAKVPEGWKKSPLLRNAYALRLDADSRWIEDTSVHLTHDLGLVIDTKETE